MVETTQEKDKSFHRPFLSRPAHYYPVWSNFIYFIAGLYAMVMVICRKDFTPWTRVLFALYGILIILTGSFSVVYHMNTPSWTGASEYTETFDKWLEIDQSFALTITIYSLLFAIYALVVNGFCARVFLDFNFWFSVLFIVLSTVFYFLGNQSTQNAFDCGDYKVCYRQHIDGYDIFHSNWHIFTSLALIFWITWIVNVFKKTFYKKDY
jgi:predicted membrane channel-forming protein YqfA (hemolysin III family)